MINGNFQFHPVGHGLFYTGQIRSANHINFVFDCGRSRFEKNSQEIREDCINNYLKSNHVQKLDMLFISHLHEDHINGIPYLLSSINNNCERVILPYFTPFQRLFLVAEYLSDENNLVEDETLQIILNPHKYFNDKGIDVIYVFGNIDYDYNDNRDEDNNINSDNSELIIYIPIRDINESDYNKDLEVLSNQKIKALSKGNIILSKFWEFIVYNGKLDDSKIIKFKNKVNEKFISLIGENNDITAENLNKIISNNEILNDLAKIYGELFKSKINDYGLMLIHRPVLAKRRFIEFEFSDSKSCYREIDCFCDCHCHCHCDCHFHHHHCSFPRHDNMCCMIFSTLLTGDRGLKFLLDNDNSDITPELKGVNIFQVPHHGSKTNWKKIKEVDGENSILKQFNDRICKFAIIPCNNTEKFPSPIVLKDIISHFFDIRIVNDIPYKYAINIRNH